MKIAKQNRIAKWMKEDKMLMENLKANNIFAFDGEKERRQFVFSKEFIFEIRSKNHKVLELLPITRTDVSEMKFIENLKGKINIYNHYYKGIKNGISPF